jgi:3',5'-cyclic AMP phosphodiesterase CpdA
MRVRNLLATLSLIGFLASAGLAQDAAREARPGRANVSAGAFLVKPYLQLGLAPKAGTLSVLWHAGDDDAAWVVESRGGTDGAWRKAEVGKPRRVAVAGVEPHRVFTATLTGLEPGATFTYRIRKRDDVVFSAEARAPKAPGQKFRFVAFGDCGAGTPEQAPLARQAMAAEPDLVVIPGDIVYDRGRVSEYRERFWPIYNADPDTSSGGGVPLMRSSVFVAAPGNHDTATRDLDKYPDGLAYFLFWDQPQNGPIGAEGGPFVPSLKASDANRRAFVEAAGAAYPRMANFSFHYGNVHWTMLDSNPYVDWTDKALKEWVAADLAAAQNATWRFVVFHHPGFTSARVHFEQQHMRLLAPVFEAGKVDVVFNGHVHNYQRSFPMRFKPDGNGALLVGKDGKTSQGRVVIGRWTLDKTFDGSRDTTPDGVIYVVTGAGGQHLYNPEQQDDQDSWQRFTDKFISTVHSLTVADVDGKTLTLRQVTAEGKEVDRFAITK